MQPLAITGLGVVSPLGVGRHAWQQAWQASAGASRAHLRPCSQLGVGHDLPVAACDGFDAATDLGAKGLRNLDRLTRQLIVAGRHALIDAGLKQEAGLTLASEAIGVSVGTAYGSLEAITELNRIAELEDPRYVNPSRFPNTVINSAAGYLSIWEGLRGPNATVVSGACSSLDAFALAATHLEQARAEAFVVAGTEALSEQSYLACARLGLLAKATKGAAPSFVLGEGAAAFCLEPLARARARQAAVQAQLVGYASGFAAPADSAQLLQVDAATLSSVMRQALEDAAVAPADIDVVCGAQSGLAPYDQAELRAVHEVFGAEVCLAAPKHWFGESFGAAGALGVAAVLAWLAGAPVAPLWPARPPPQQAVRAVLVLDVGHYGNASALVLRLDDPTANPSRS